MKKETVKESIKVEMTSQIKLALTMLSEKLSRVIPFTPSEILIKNGEITVKE